MSIIEIPEPWKSFLKDVDEGLSQEASLHCTGGFVITQLWGMSRNTSDLDLAIQTKNPSEGSSSV